MNNSASRTLTCERDGYAPLEHEDGADTLVCPMGEMWHEGADPAPTPSPTDHDAALALLEVRRRLGLPSGKRGDMRPANDTWDDWSSLWAVPTPGHDASSPQAGDPARQPWSLSPLASAALVFAAAVLAFYLPSKLDWWAPEPSSRASVTPHVGAAGAPRSDSTARSSERAVVNPLAVRVEQLEVEQLPKTHSATGSAQRRTEGAQRTEADKRWASRTRKAESLLRQEQPARAAAAFRHALRRQPRHAPGWARMGDAHLAAGHPRAALSAYRRARHLAPDEAAYRADVRRARKVIQRDQATVASAGQ